MLLKQKHRTYYVPLFLLVSTMAVTAFILFKKQFLPEKPIVAVITSFNNAKWVYKNLDSIFNQDYKNFRVIYCDDCSTDGTGDLVEQYIKEKNVRDKITLIRNKKRAIKLLNLYTIHHSIHDWDIIAQIDGDDWLIGTDVFKEINKAYHNGCWLAYTQFECSNGQKGSNALPPYWIRKNGTFRQYKPTWFMYSHLKTFYAWLFKQIKLHDLIDDQSGTFPNVSDDVLMMYPMLEMARNHITFIPKSYYVWNVAPGFRFMPEADQATDLQKVFFKKPAYSELEQPILRNSEKTHADVVLLWQRENCQSIERMLQSLKNYVRGIGSIYVLYYENNALLHEIMKKYPDIIFSDYKQMSTIFDKLSDYIVLADDQNEITKSIALNTYINQIEKTGAYAFHLAPIVQKTMQKQKKQNSALQIIDNGVYAYKYGALKNKQNSYKNSWALYRKKDVKDLLMHFVVNKDEILGRWSPDPTKIGLLLEKSPLKKNT